MHAFIIFVHLGIIIVTSLRGNCHVLVLLPGGLLKCVPESEGFYTYSLLLTHFYVVTLRRGRPRARTHEQLFLQNYKS